MLKTGKYNERSKQMIKIKTSNAANVQSVVNPIFINFAGLAAALFSKRIGFFF
jgi:hypothetical protein